MTPEYCCLTVATVVVFVVESACWSDSSACWEALPELNEQLLKNGRHIETTRMSRKGDDDGLHPTRGVVLIKSHEILLLSFRLLFAAASIG